MKKIINGRPIPPAAAHLFKLHGVKVFKHTLKDPDDEAYQYPNNWVRTDGPKFLQAVDDFGERDVDKIQWIWCAPTAVALLVAPSPENRDDALAIATWLVEHVEVQALEALWGLSNDENHYREQARTVFKDKEKKDDS